MPSAPGSRSGEPASVRLAGLKRDLSADSYEGEDSACPDQSLSDQRNLAYRDSHACLHRTSAIWDACKRAR